MGSLGRCLARGLLRGQPGIRLPFGPPRCYGSGETRPRPTLRAVPIPVPSHPLMPLRTRSPFFPLSSPCLVLGDPSPPPSIVPSRPAVPVPWGLVLGSPGADAEHPPGNVGRALAQSHPLSCPGTRCPVLLLHGSDNDGDAGPCWTCPQCLSQLWGTRSPYPTLGAWGTSQ